MVAPSTPAAISHLMAAPSGLEALVSLAYISLQRAQEAFLRLPGSAVLVRYIKSSHQNDPGRTLLEIILIIFAIRTLVQSRTRSDPSGHNFVQLSEKVRERLQVLSLGLTSGLQEIDELVDEWTPDPLTDPLSEKDKAELASIPVVQGAAGPRPKLLNNGKTVVNLASYNFVGLQGNERAKERAIQTLRKYGLGSCGPPGFYGTIGK